MFQKDGKYYLVEPQLRRIGEKFPRLSTLRYEPKFSVAWNGEKVTFYSHSQNRPVKNFAFVLSLIPEWLFGWGRFWLWVAYRMPVAIFRRITRKRSRENTGSPISPES